MDAAEEFGAEVARGDGAALDRLALLIASCGDGPLDVDDELARLDRLADEFSGNTAAELMGWMGIRGFRGNADDYYDPANSFLNQVLDRRLGIPISLSVLAIEIGRRHGIGLVGIGLPGEFIVAERDEPDRFHNPFRQTSMDPAAVDALVRRVAGPGTGLTAEMRVPVSPIGIVNRMLTNLSHIYAHTEQPAELEWVLRLQIALPGTGTPIHRQLVAVLARLGRFWEASEVLVALMAREAAAGNDDELEADEAMLLQLRSNLN